MPTRLFNDSREEIILGREIARGGEGAIYEIPRRPEVVAKIYHKTLTDETVAKLAAMSRIATPELLKIAAWPSGTLYETPGGELQGIILPRVVGHREVHELYSPGQRRQYFPNADWEFLVFTARNLAAAIGVVHSFGHVLGDVNQRGVLVSDRATVRLIDCDSFQFQNNGHLFKCTVGVPEYTAPELQGKNFAGVERSQEHDRFGLALLIFHLLFMGKHPFAGRFSGSGDMSIEKAIVEGRFAFSRSSASFQMSPPPYSLLLQTLPESVAAMFERAFCRPGLGSKRPTAEDWRAALANLKFGTCAKDKGHRYPTHLTSCPWCEIMRQGGPNYFVSYQVAIGGVQLEVPTIDLVLLWGRIENVKPPINERPAYPPPHQSLRPTPLSEELSEQRFLSLVIGAVLIISLFVVFVGLLVHRLVAYIGLTLTVVFGIWSMVLRSTTGFGAEIKRRQARAKALRAHLDQEQTKWDKITTDATLKFSVIKNDLRSIKEQGDRIRHDFEMERRVIEARQRDDQLKEFLDTHFIRNYRIPKIGAGRQATLLSYGIETAADVIEERLDGIQGFGPNLIFELMEWKRELAKKFVFDAKKPLPKAALQNLVMKYRQKAQMCDARLTGGAEELRTISEASNSFLSAVGNKIFALVDEVRQADIDAKVRTNFWR